MDSRIKPAGAIYRVKEWEPFTGAEHFKHESFNREGELLRECMDGWYINERTLSRFNLDKKKEENEAFDKYYEKVDCSTQYVLYDGRYLSEPNRAAMFSVCEDMKEATEEAPDYGDDTVIVRKYIEKGNCIISEIVSL